MAAADLEPRVRELEQQTAVHEAVCAERYRGINLRLNIIMTALGVLLAAVAGGNPVLELVGRLLGGH